MVSVIYTRALNALYAPEVRVEVHISNGLPAFTIVGMPETAVKESKDRGIAAIGNSGFFRRQIYRKRAAVMIFPLRLEFWKHQGKLRKTQSDMSLLASLL